MGLIGFRNYWHQPDETVHAFSRSLHSSVAFFITSNSSTTWEHEQPTRTVTLLVNSLVVGNRCIKTRSALKYGGQPFVLLPDTSDE